MTMLRISWRDACTLVVEGEVDLSTAGELVRAAADAPAAGLRVDLSLVTFIDVSGVRTLLALSRTQATGVLVVESPHPRVLRVLDLLAPEGAPWFRVAVGDEGLVGDTS